MRLVTWSAVAALLLVLCPAVRAQSACADPRKIYYGDPEGVKPATVRADACFAAIPEWQEIQRRKLGSNDADYWILVTAANERFHAAVERVAKAAAYDLVAEQGAIDVPEGQAAPPDATQAVVAEIKKSADKKGKE